MSGSGPDAPQPGSAEESRLQEAERDWEAAKAFYDNLVTKRPRPVSGGGMGLGVSKVPGMPPLHSSRPAAQASACHHGGRLVPSPLRPGGGAADLRGARGGEVRGVPAGERERHPEARTGVSLRQGARLGGAVDAARADVGKRRSWEPSLREDNPGPVPPPALLGAGTEPFLLRSFTDRPQSVASLL